METWSALLDTWALKKPSKKTSICVDKIWLVIKGINQVTIYYPNKLKTKTFKFFRRLICVKSKISHYQDDFLFVRYNFRFREFVKSSSGLEDQWVHLNEILDWHSTVNPQNLKSNLLVKLHRSNLVITVITVTNDLFFLHPLG